VKGTGTLWEFITTHDRAISKISPTAQAQSSTVERTQEEDEDALKKIIILELPTYLYGKA